MKPKSIVFLFIAMLVLIGLSLAQEINSVKVEAIPSAPSNFGIYPNCNPEFSQTSDPYLDLGWTDNSSYEIGFNIYRSETPVKPLEVYQTVKADSWFFDDYNVTPGHRYYYWVTAYNNNGESSVVGPKYQYAPRDVHVQNVRATNITQNSITWSWDAVSGATHYYLGGDGSSYNSVKTLSYTKNNLQPNTFYEFTVLPGYLLESNASFKGCWSAKVTAITLGTTCSSKQLSDEVEGSVVIVGVGERESLIISDFNLFQNYPNPFNPETTISFQLKRASNVFLAVYNMRGEQVAVLAEGFKSVGSYSVQWNGVNQPSGVYFVVFRTGSFSKTMKMVLKK